MDIHSSAVYPANALSNFAPHPFVFDGVKCASMEGLLQSFKFRDRAKQLALCEKEGLDAKYAGRAGNGWRKTQKLYWNGVQYDRHSREYIDLLMRAYEALLENPGFQKALLATGWTKLTHHLGSEDPEKTVLTAIEFCGILNHLRQRLRDLARARP